MLQSTDWSSSYNIILNDHRMEDDKLKPKEENFQLRRISDCVN